jgi:hypothetical protein
LLIGVLFITRKFNINLLEFRRLNKLGAEFSHWSKKEKALERAFSFNVAEAVPIAIGIDPTSVPQ